MSTSEFEIIEQYFRRGLHYTDHHRLSIGDDAALIRTPPNHMIATSIDTFTEGVHFPINTNAFNIGHKSLAISLSDIAAMGAQPTSVLLALSMPTYDADWLSDFCEGFFKLARRFRVDLIGGDTTRGPLTITTAVHGLIPERQALTRSRAKVGDRIYVTGTVGDAALGLEEFDKGEPLNSFLRKRLHRPSPRIAIGIALREIAHAAIDISDGLAADLSKLINASNVGADIHVNKLPLSKAMQDRRELNAAWQLALNGGDDYELCFTIPEANLERIERLDRRFRGRLHEIGVITDSKQLNILDINNKPFELQRSGFDHFTTELNTSENTN